MSIESIVEKISGRVAEGSFDKSVKFDLGDAGVIVIDGKTVSTEDGPADCTISMSLEDLMAMTAGELDPTGAFMQGKLKVEGDMSVAMQLSQVL